MNATGQCPTDGSRTSSKRRGGDSERHFDYDDDDDDDEFDGFDEVNESH
jgi:hypothetical protein